MHASFGRLNKGQPSRRCLLNLGLNNVPHARDGQIRGAFWQPNVLPLEAPHAAGPVNQNFSLTFHIKNDVPCTLVLRHAAVNDYPQASRSNMMFL